MTEDPELTAPAIRSLSGETTAGPDAVNPETLAARAGVGADRQHGAVMPPLHLSSTFAFDGYEGKREYDYTRSGNPTRDQFATALAGLEKGAGAVVTSSGMSALLLVFHLIDAGETVIAPHDGYGGTCRLLRALEAQGRLKVRFVHMTDLDEVKQAVADSAARMILVESPSNPLLRITDLAAVAEIARTAGALYVVDNTFLSPAFQRPIEFGADLVVHSTTKYINGHSDVVGGAVIARTESLQEDVAWWGNCLGVTGAPFDSFLALRGLRTLHLRAQRHGANAGRLAELVAGHPAVDRTYYPGLDRHPGHDLAARQQSGFGGIVSFDLAAGVPAVRAFLDGLKHFALAESLGGVESLVAHPATMTHLAMEPEMRRAAGIGDGLLRLSVGIENADDLAADIETGLDRAIRAERDAPIAVSGAGI